MNFAALLEESPEDAVADIGIRAAKFILAPF
jgi:hypothetical protein